MANSSKEREQSHDGSRCVLLWRRGQWDDSVNEYNGFRVSLVSQKPLNVRTWGLSPLTFLFFSIDFLRSSSLVDLWDGAKCSLECPTTYLRRSLVHILDPYAVSSTSSSTLSHMASLSNSLSCLCRFPPSAISGFVARFCCQRKG